MTIHKLAQFPQSLSCPHCNSSFFIRTGKVKSIQRYQCKDCGRSFRDTTATPVHHLHKKEKIAKYLEALHQGLSVRKSAKYAGISKNTAFSWRHKFLSSLRSQPHPQQEKSAGGATIIRLPYSAKGRKKAPEKNSQPTKSLLISTKDKIILRTINHQHSTLETAKIIQTTLKDSYLATIKDNLLKRAINKITTPQQIQNKKLKEHYISITKQSENILFEWMQRFRGVASKYLQNYWSWHVSLIKSQKMINGDQDFRNWCIEQRSLSQYFHLKEI